MTSGFKLRAVLLRRDHEPFRQRLAQAIRLTLVVGLSIVEATHEASAQQMIDVVVPLRRVARQAAIALAHELRRDIVLILANQVQMPALRKGMHTLRQLIQNMLRAVVDNGMRCIQPKSIHVVLFQPEQRILQDEFARLSAALAVKVQRRAPGGLMILGEDLRKIEGQVIPFRTEVVVHHIQEHHNLPLMRRLHKRLQRLRPPICRIWRIQQHGVIAPAACSCKIRNGHQLNRGHTQCGQVIQLTRGSLKCTLGRKRADVQFIQHGFRPWPPVPVAGLPRISGRIDHLARAGHVLGLKSRCRIGHIHPVRQHVTVARSRSGVGNRKLMPTVSIGLHRLGFTPSDRQPNRIHGRTKETEPGPDPLCVLRTEGLRVTPTECLRRRTVLRQL